MSRTPAWAERIKAEIDAASANTNNRRAAVLALEEIAEYAQSEADIIRGYELNEDA